MKLSRIIRILILIIPALFLYLVISTGDSFYLLLVLVSLIFSLLFIFKGVLSSSVIHLPKRLKKLRKKADKVEVEISHDIEKIKHARKKIELPFFKLVVILLWNTVVILLIILTTLPLIHEENLFVAYYKSISELLFSSALNSIAVIFYIVANLVILFVLLKNQVKKKRKRVLASLGLVAPTIVLAINLSLLASFLYGIGLKNYKVLEVNSNPQKAGLIWGKQPVKENLQNMDRPPKILGSDIDTNERIADLVSGTSNTDNFLQGNILASIPGTFLFIKLNIPDESLIMYKDYLVITELNKEEIEEVSPTIAKLFVKDYLNPRYIKDEPYVRLMGRQEYLKYRDDKINEQIAEIENLIEETQSYINLLYSNINQARQKIAENEQGISESIQLRDYYYEQCKNAGYYSYYFGYFYRYYSDAECDSRRAEWDSLIAEFQQNINDWNYTLTQSQRALPEWQEWKTTLEGVRELVASQKERTPHELGVFEPEKSVKVVLESTSTESLADFFATLVHEYYHYSSYISEERTLPYFFEEGLTEYFARKTIRENLNVETQIGYPMTTRIIEEMAEKIPESRLEEVYFTKNGDELVSLLNEAYGASFYEDSEFYFTAIYYSPITDETIKFANNIMFKIGGGELSVDDLTSYKSRFE